METGLARIVTRMTPDHKKNPSLCTSRSSCWCRNSWIRARGIFHTVYLRGYSFCRANSRHTLNTDVCQCHERDTYHPGIDSQMSASRNWPSIYDGSGWTVTP